MHLTATIANSLWLASNLPRRAAFRRALADPATAQHTRLSQYLSENAATRFGRAHNFAALRTAADYQAAVPLSAYDDYLSHIDAIRAGEANVLTAAPVTHLIPTSGSSGPRKLIPYTAALQREFNAAIGPWIVDLYTRHPSLLAGRAYWSISPAAVFPSDADSMVPVGFDDDSAYLGGFAKRLVDAALAVPNAVRHIPDIDTFRYVTLLLLLRATDLRLISVWHPSFLTLLLDAAPRHWESLLRDLATGSCNPPAALAPNVHTAPKQYLQPSPTRSRALAAIGPHAVDRFWPDLRVISCWTDAAAEGYAARLRRLFPNVTIQGKGLIATEAFVTLPFGHGHRPLAVRSHFFEFLQSDGRPVLAGAVEPGGEYTPAVTTAGGLYRYRLHDRLRAGPRLRSTPTFTFLGRSDNTLDRCGEKLGEPFVTAVIDRLVREHQLAPTFVLFAPHDNADGLAAPAYVLYLQSATRPDPSVARALDKALAANPHYAYCRHLGQLGPAKVFHVIDAGYDSLAKFHTARGDRIGDLKPSPCTRLPIPADIFVGQFVADDAPPPAPSS